MKKPLTDAQQRLVKLDLARPAIDKYYEDLEQTLKDVQAEIGTDGFFQSEDGTVYQIVKPNGTFVTFRELGFIRTKRSGEERGSLSVKKAQEAGFTVS